MATCSSVQLVVEDFGGDAAAISRLIGLEPTAVGTTERSPADDPSLPASWIFEIALPPTESVEGQALALLRFLESHAEEIRQAALCYPASIAIAIADGNPRRPGDEIDLVPLITADISKLGLGLRIHFSASATPEAETEG